MLFLIVDGRPGLSGDCDPGLIPFRDLYFDMELTKCLVVSPGCLLLLWEWSLTRGQSWWISMIRNILSNLNCNSAANLPFLQFLIKQVSMRVIFQPYWQSSLGALASAVYNLAFPKKMHEWLLSIINSIVLSFSSPQHQNPDNPSDSVDVVLVSLTRLKAWCLLGLCLRGRV